MIPSVCQKNRPSNDGQTLLFLRILQCGLTHDQTEGRIDAVSDSANRGSTDQPVFSDQLACCIQIRNDCAILFDDLKLLIDHHAPLVIRTAGMV